MSEYQYYEFAAVEHGRKVTFVERLGHAGL